MKSQENNISQSTPMGRVWKVVIASMVITLIAGYIWHVMSLNEQRMYNLHENEQLETEITKLTLYRDQLTGTSTIPKSLPQ